MPLTFKTPYLSFLLLALTLSCHSKPDPLPGFPKLVLWAWERPENLSFIIPAETGVAYLAETINFGEDGVTYLPRMQPLRVPNGTSLIAVFRMESHTPPAPPPPISDVVAQIVRTVNGRPVRAVQIDFDARASERAYYQEFMQQLRHSLPQNLPLQMTALVSWCQSDNWISHMPVADAIPMFFRMGPDTRSADQPLREPLCSSSFGIATDEFSVHVPPHRRVFVFTNHPWTELAYRSVLQESHKW